MQYFKIKHSLESSQIGSVYPQIQNMSRGYKYDAPNSVYSLSSEVDSLPNYTPNLNYFVLNPKSKITDFLSTSVVSGGLLVSLKVKLLLQQFNLPLHKFYPGKLFHNGTFFDCFWLHIICDMTDLVDYNMSTFYIYHNYTQNLGYITIESKDDFLNKKLKLKNDNPGKNVTIWSEDIVLKNTPKNTLDLFEIGLFDANIYITAALKNKLIFEKVTGLDIIPTDNIKFKT